MYRGRGVGTHHPTYTLLRLYLYDGSVCLSRGFPIAAVSFYSTIAKNAMETSRLQLPVTQAGRRLITSVLSSGTERPVCRNTSNLTPHETFVRTGDRAGKSLGIGIDRPGRGVPEENHRSRRRRQRFTVFFSHRAGRRLGGSSSWAPSTWVPGEGQLL